ncbi:MAG: peptide ABC transporter ATP-binding protein [Candidatus Hydromicrobium americanum]|nr:MAG: peptide ABC transporter ATP-binding protein [Candidatus Hydromicrobium americanum]
MSIINITNLYKTYGSGESEVKALRGLSLSVDNGDMIAVMGPSGSGKSTLLNIIGCIDKPTGGKYLLSDRLIDTFNDSEMAELRNQKFGFVVQDFALVERYNVYKNVMIPLTYSKKQIKLKRDKIGKVLSQLGILEKKKAMALNLSMGQRQRVAIARAIVNDPDIILADEPTGSLDSDTGSEVMDILKKLNEDGKTILIVTHDMNVASYCRRIVKIQDGKVSK